MRFHQWVFPSPRISDFSWLTLDWYLNVKVGFFQEGGTSQAERFYLRSSRFFFLSLIHTFLSPICAYDLYDPKGTSRTLSHAQAPLPKMFPSPVLSQLVTDFCSDSNGVRRGRWWTCLGGLSVSGWNLCFDDASFTLHNVCYGDNGVWAVEKVTLSAHELYPGSDWTPAHVMTLETK